MQHYLTQRDRDNFGDDLLDLTQRGAMHAVSPHLANLQQQNEALLRGLAQERRHRLDQQVAELVPDYKTIDEEPAWHRFLLGVDPMSGRIRQALLDDAIRKGNPERVRAMFDAYRGSADRSGSAGGASSTRRSRAAASAPVYTRDTIAKLYEAHRRGDFANRQAEWDRIEADIFDAQRTGRVAMHPWVSK
jgi:hypothetical protein